MLSLAAFAIDTPRMLVDGARTVVELIRGDQSYVLVRICEVADGEEYVVEQWAALSSDVLGVNAAVTITLFGCGIIEVRGYSGPLDISLPREGVTDVVTVNKAPLDRMPSLLENEGEI